MFKRMVLAASLAVLVCLATAQAGEKFAFIFKSTGNPFGEKLMEGYKKAIEEQGHECILRAPDLPTAEAQIMIIEELIAQRVAAIGISRMIPTRSSQCSAKPAAPVLKSSPPIRPPTRPAAMCISTRLIPN